MKHATSDDLKNIGQLLEEIRKMHGIAEKVPGHFYFAGKNVLHFHEDHGSIYADIGEARVKVTESSYSEIMKRVEIYISEVKLARSRKDQG